MELTPPLAFQPRDTTRNFVHDEAIEEAGPTRERARSETNPISANRQADRSASTIAKANVYLLTTGQR